MMRLSWYLAQAHLRTVAALLVGMMAVLFLFRFAEVARTAAESGAQWSYWLVWEAVLRLPIELQNLLPHVIIVSAAVAMHRASTRFEIAVMIQSGLAGWRLLVPLLVSGALVGLGHTALGSQLSSAANAHIEAVAAHPQEHVAQRLVLDGPQGTIFLLADKVAPKGDAMRGVTVIRTDARHALVQRFRADHAIWTGAVWQLDGVTVLHASADGAAPMLDIDPTLLGERPASRLAVPLFALPRAIAYTKAVGAAGQGYRLQWLEMWMLPIQLGLLAALAGAVALHPLPKGRWGGAAVAVLGLAFAVYTVSTLIETMALHAVIAPEVAVMVVPGLCLAGLFLWQGWWRW